MCLNSRYKYKLFLYDNIVLIGQARSILIFYMALGLIDVDEVSDSQPFQSLVDLLECGLKGGDIIIDTLGEICFL